MIPCALIGLGRIASLLEDDVLREKPASHAGAIAACPDTFIAAGMDIDHARRADFAARWGVEAVYDDAAAMIDDVRPQILHICTHADSHLRFLKLAIVKDVPVVVLEKPVADSLSQARRLVRRLEASRTRVVVNHERRYSRDYLRVKKLIGEGDFGPLRSVTGRLFMGNERPLEAVLLYDGTHLFDIISFLLGGPLGKVRRAGGPAAGTEGLRTIYVTADCGGTPVVCEIGNGRDHVVFELEFSFASGRIRVGNGIYEEYESRESPYYEKMRSLIPREVENIGPTGYFAGMFADAVGLLDNPERKPISSYRDGLDSLRMVARIRRMLSWTRSILS